MKNIRNTGDDHVNGKYVAPSSRLQYTSNITVLLLQKMHAALIVHRTSQSKHIHLKPLSTILDDFVLSFRDNEVSIKGIDIVGIIRTFTI